MPYLDHYIPFDQLARALALFATMIARKGNSLWICGLQVTTRSISSFQGHYTNRSHEDQCHGSRYQQSRTFLNFSKDSRKREYCGRQLVGHTMEQMYDVVSDVGNYYKFVPFCKKSLILSKSPGNLKADLIIGFPPINERYTSNVTLVRPFLVKAECTEGRLFDHMLSLWRFSPGLKRLQRSCVVDFQISFEFKSAVHSHLSNLFFDQVARQMEGAFIKEVARRYGPASMQPRNLLIKKGEYETNNNS